MKIIKNILITIITTALLSISAYQIYRYIPLKPMPDYHYKMAIVKESQNPLYRVENLRSVAGEDELKDFLFENNDNPQIYTPSIENIEQGLYRANLHMHTTNSDGVVSVKERLDEAQQYAQEHLKKNEKFFIAITDHNTVSGAKDVIEILQKNPKKYNKLKVVPGMEINTSLYSEQLKTNVDIHVLAWCINPYDKFLNTEFRKKNINDKLNIVYPLRNFDDLVRMMSFFGYTAVAHPARYIYQLGENKYAFIEEMMGRYKEANSLKPSFIEGYYQSYIDCNENEKLGNDYGKTLEHIKHFAKLKGIIQTGSTDAHGPTIFRMR